MFRLPLGSAVKFSIPQYASVSTYRSASANHYEVLGLQKNCSQEEIKKAYIKMAKEMHPDMASKKSQKKHERFIEVNAAYSILNNPSDRKQYDSLMAYQFRSGNHHPNHQSATYDSQEMHPGERPMYGYRRNVETKDWSQEFPKADDYQRYNNSYIVVGILAFTVVGIGVTLGMGLWWSAKSRAADREKSDKTAIFYEEIKRKAYSRTGDLVDIKTHLRGIKNDLSDKKP